MNEQEIIEFLKEKLALEVESESVYCGGDMESGSMFKECHTLTLCLDGEPISGVYLD